MQSELKDKNLFIIAAAGSGKTTYLVNEALSIKNGNILITTFTEANDKEIKNRIIGENRFLPKNVTVQTWFSMILQHGVRPYQGYFIEEDIIGMNLTQGQSATYVRESNVKRHYCDSSLRMYSDKLSKFTLKCNEASGGKVISRLSRIYSHIFIDEVQDLAGYDLELIQLLCSSNIKVILVGDPRQGTFSTNNNRKNKKYRQSNIIEYFKDNVISSLTIKNDLLIKNRRSIQAICDLADKLFPKFNKTTSETVSTEDHLGIFLVKTAAVERYISTYQPTILRDSRRTIVSSSSLVMNFGVSKGLTFDRILIYPTKPILKWLKNNESTLTPSSRSKLYVAITRARLSVAFVYDYTDSENIDGCAKYD